MKKIKIFNILLFIFTLFLFCFVLQHDIKAADELTEIELSNAIAFYRDSNGVNQNCSSSPVLVPAGEYEVTIQTRFDDGILKKNNSYDIELHLNNKTQGNTLELISLGSSTGVNFTYDDIKVVNGVDFTKVKVFGVRSDETDIIFFRFRLTNVVENVPNGSSGRIYFPDIKLFYNNVTTETSVKSILDLLKQIPTNIANALRTLFGNIVDAIDVMKSFLGSAIQNLLDGLTSVLTTVKNALVQLLQNIVDGLVTLGNFILDGLKVLFIPDVDFFKNYFTSLNDFFAQKLGFLYFPVDLLVTVINAYLNLDNGTGIIDIPAFEYMDATLWSKQSYNIKAAFTQFLGDNYDLYYAFVDTILILAFLNFVKSNLDAVLYGTAPASAVQDSVEAVRPEPKRVVVRGFRND